jgi:hypothetical protein
LLGGELKSGVRLHGLYDSAADSTFCLCRMGRFRGEYCV